jgi:hypothetical protein
VRGDTLRASFNSHWIYTMYRCVLAAVAAFGVCAAVPLPASAQQPLHMQRAFPQNALRGTIEVTSAFDVTLNGRPARLAPGSRIRNTDNMLEMSGSLIGREFVANYTIEDSGLVRDIWMLRPDERAKRPWPTTMEQARNWVFDPAAQTWSRP